MNQRRNKRTLKKRIRKALSLSTTITVMFLSTVIIALILMVSHIVVAYQAEMIGTAIAKDINSGAAAKFMGIENIKDLQENDPKIRKWISGLDKKSILIDFFPYIDDQSNMYVEIVIKEKIIYSNKDQAVDNIFEEYEDTQVTRDILDQDKNVIGSIWVTVNPQIIFGILVLTIGVILLLSITAMLVSKILSLFLTIPIINPINQLEKKVKAIAEGDQETALNTELSLKRPLREIESLINSTNMIMKKLHAYNYQLESQKDILENQNSELEMQNEELLQSKFHIQQQQAKLIQSEKMASVGMLTAAITHEINTPIGAINSNAQMEEMILMQMMNHPAIQADEDLSMLFTQLKELNDVNLIACSRINEIIRSLKSYSRLDQAEFQETDINDCIKNVLVLTHNLLKRRINVHENYEKIPFVKCFPGQLNQVFMNIIVNASQAIEEEGDIYIHTYQVDRDIYISIRDTGVGIKQEDISKLFEPGYTTKGVGVGLGLGLYLSYNLIQNHKGKISVFSEPGKGAEFIISIPMDHERT